MVIELKALLTSHMQICENDKKIQTAAVAGVLRHLDDMKADNRRDFDALAHQLGAVTDKTDGRFGEQQKINSGSDVHMAAINARMDGKILTFTYWIIGALGAAVVFMFLKLQHWA